MSIIHEYRHLSDETAPPAKPMLDPRLEDDVRRRRAASGRVRNAPRYSWIDVVIWIVALGRWRRLSLRRRGCCGKR